MFSDLTISCSFCRAIGKRWRGELGILKGNILEDFTQLFCCYLYLLSLRLSQPVCPSTLPLSYLFLQPVLRIRIRDPVLYYPWIRDPESGMSKKPGSGFGMNNPSHISESLETVFWLKYLDSFMQIRIRNLGSGIFVILDQGSRIRDITILDPG